MIRADCSHYVPGTTVADRNKKSMLRVWVPWHARLVCTRRKLAEAMLRLPTYCERIPKSSPFSLSKDPRPKSSVILISSCVELGTHQFKGPIIIL